MHVRIKKKYFTELVLNAYWKFIEIKFLIKRDETSWNFFKNGLNKVQ